MLVNDEDLIPLNTRNESKKSDVDALDEPNGFLSRMADADDSVERLLAARAEAESAEEKAKASGETALPYAKEKRATEKSRKIDDEPLISRGYSLASDSDDSDSPAPINAFGAGALARLSDATQEGHETVEDYKPTDETMLGELKGLPGQSKSGTWTTIGSNDLDGSPAAAESLRTLDDVHIDELLELTVKYGASDLHLTTDLPPMVRKDGKLQALPFQVADAKLTRRIVFDILSNNQIEKFERTHELDFSHGVRKVGRFRFNVYQQREALACAMRVIPNKIPTIEELKLPIILKEMTRKHSGLVLVTGPTGSGKSTTIASMIDIINNEREVHILTIEDPIEYLHHHKRAMVNQRELGEDTDSFNNALRAALREDPDVILVGEMRDLETIAAAITLAETGHLVFATLHTRSAAATVDRIVDVFPSFQQAQIRMQLSTSLEAVVAQQLMPRIGGGRISAIEIMIATSAIRNLIREGKTYQITSVIETGHQYGMQAMDKVLADHFRSGAVTFEEAGSRAIDRENFQRLVKGF